MTVLFYLSVIMLALLAVKIGVFLRGSSQHHKAHRRQTSVLTTNPLVTIVVPCYNEELVLENCVRSLKRQTYTNTEIMLVDDGSSDLTQKLGTHLAERYDNVQLLTKSNGGKASALNAGIARTRGSIVICMDADSMFPTTTVEQLVLSFQDPDIDAIGGNVRVANRTNTMGRHQAAEYISGLTIQRRTFAHLGCMQVISGALGAFRRDALETIGGYSEDTIVEDMDITVSLAKAGLNVSYNPDAIAYTEAPERVGDFLKQRYRWTFGSFQVAAKHRDMLANREFGRMGMIGLPYAVFFPWVDATISVLLLIAVIRAAILGNGWALLAFYVVLTTIQVSILTYALIIDNENKKLAVMAAVEHLFYSHLINMTTIWAGVNYMKGKKTSWNKLRRFGRNTMDAGQPSRPLAVDDVSSSTSWN